VELEYLKRHNQSQCYKWMVTLFGELEGLSEKEAAKAVVIKSK
jgi:hypothetical protein